VNNLSTPTRRAALRMGALAALMTTLGRSALAQSPTDFKMAVFQSEVYLAEYVAKDMGLDIKNGLRLSFVTPSSGTAAAQLMLAGAIQGWVTDPMIIYNAASSGNDIAIAGIEMPNLNYTVLVSKEGRWPATNASFQDKMNGLKGKRIGVSGIGAGTDNALLLMLKAAGIASTDVTRVAIGQQQAAIGQFMGGGIDAFVSFALAGNAVIEEEAGAKRYISTQDPIVPDSVRRVPHAALAVSGEYAAKNPQVIASWLSMLRESVAWIRANPNEAAVVLDKNIFNGKRLEVAKRIIPQMLETYFLNTRSDFKMPQQAYEAMVEAGKDLAIVKNAKPVSYEALVLRTARLN
jgi:ABC-type nitrate/sulfonate/bicarbonate transport system substrate-binding protein